MDKNLLSGAEDEKVSIPLGQYLSIRNAALQNERKTKGGFVIEETDIAGSTNKSKDRVELNVAFKIRTYGRDDEWLTIPLLPQSLTVTSSELSGDTTAAESGAGAYIAPKESGSGLVVHCLGGQRSFTAKFVVHVPFNGQQHESFRVSGLPPSLTNHLSIDIETNRQYPGGKSAGVDAKVDPLVGTVESQEKQTPDGRTVTSVVCNFPSSSTLDVQWRERIKEETKPEKEISKATPQEKKRTIVTAIQNTLYSIGEGMVKTRTVYDVTVTHGARSVFEIDVFSTEKKDLRVLSVQGRAIKRWQLTDATGPAGAGSSKHHQDDTASEPSTPGSVVGVIHNQAGKQDLRQRLLIWFEYGAEGQFQLTVNSELEMLSNSAPVRVPCFAARNVDRETGHAAVEARTNVEINELERAGAGRIDVGELPSAIQTAAANPILHAYKFLETPYAVRLDVTKHEDAQSLVAVIEECWLQATQSDDSLLHRVVMSVRNSQKQFVRISVPGDQHEIWSSIVNGEPVKAAVDQATKDVMIPLEKTSGGDSQAKPFLVELVYMTKSGKMEKRGTLDLAFAKFDIPIQQLYVTVYLPSSFKYGEFQGSLKETHSYSRPCPTAGDGGPPMHPPAPGPAGRSGPARMQWKDDYQEREERACMDMEQGLHNNVRRDPLPLKSKKKAVSGGLSLSGLMSVGQGHVPVKIAKLEVGTRFNFRKLLVQPEYLKLTVPFKAVEKKNTRTLDKVPWYKCGGKCNVM